MEKSMSTSRSKLVKIIRDAGSKFDDYSVPPKIRQILLHRGYQLTKKIFFEWSDKLIYENEGSKRLNNSVTYERGVL